jgi:myo-inositol-1(or 4)-monophosphatase
MNELLTLATHTAHEAGAFIRANFGTELNVNEMQKYDIKLELDVRSQALITDLILKTFPEHAILGEEGGEIGGQGDVEWIIDPIDGTVNYFYNIPHFCVSIAARDRRTHELLVGVIFDPMQNETWAVAKDTAPTLNGKPIQCSGRSEMKDCIVTVGFSKSKESINAGFERYQRIAYEVRKTRMMGSAALAMAYIACGRLDAYVEEQISLWDIAAGQMLIEACGGTVKTTPNPNKPGTMFICAWNGKMPIESYV